MFLDIKDVDFGYQNEAKLLQGFDLQVERGEFVALLGPSGCGKSTLMNLAAGLLHPLSGECRFDGRALRGLNREVGYMTQGDTLLPWATVAKNIVLPLELRHVPKAQREERLARVMDLVNLSQARDKFPSELSGGMKRRALLARSIIYDPAMLLMDEPFGALDAQLREVMHQELLATVARTGQSVLFITHDISEAVLLADRVVVLGGLPLRILEEIIPPYGKDRVIAQVRTEESYVEIERHLRELLREADALTKSAKMIN